MKRRLVPFALIVLIGMAAVSVILTRGPEGTTIDSWTVGPISSECGWDTCEEVIQAPTLGLGNRDPFHAEATSVAIHEIGIDIFSERKAILNVGGPRRQVVVFKLADGSWRAIGVGHIGISQVLMVWERPDSGPGHQP